MSLTLGGQMLREVPLVLCTTVCGVVFLFSIDAYGE